MADTNNSADDSTGKRTMPFGTWPSGLAASTVADQGRRLAEPQWCSGAIYWLESRPQEQGRVQVVQQTAEGELADLLPEGFSARSKVHEYGGGSYLATAAALYFVNGGDQQVYALALSGAATPRPQPLTHGENQRFADLQLDPNRQRLLAVCEHHASDSVENYLVSIPLDNIDNVPDGIVEKLVHGADFYSSPRISPDGKRLSWLTWSNPDMPWDSTQLWLAELDSDGRPEAPRCVAGNAGAESLFQPQWSPDGDLYFVSDRTGWWNIYRIPRDCLAQHSPAADAVTTLEAEFATPQWAFNMSTYCFLGQDELLATYTCAGRWHLCRIDVASGEATPVPSTMTQFTALNAPANQNGECVLLAASPTENPGVFRFASDRLNPVKSLPAPIEKDDVSTPRSITFPTSEGQQAYGFFYAPRNAKATGPSDSLPPLIVICHGGPTGATETSLNLKIQYWTNRGFAVLDVNYRGSTGYGRDYRQALYGHWGVRDVDDVCAGADYVTQQGWAHPEQRIIKGSSAGGYTVLAALAFRDAFNAGVSLYGIGDLELLATDTHKFEARYLDKLVGPYPQEKARYRALSPLYHTDKLACALLVFQGLEDKVVPPNQASAMVEAVDRQKLPVAYATYATEGHGFRQADTIVHMLAAEQYFYQRVFGLGADTAAEPPIHIRNLPASEGSTRP